jgi:hypothetical protein
MISFQTIKEHAKNAYCNGEFYEFLTGKKGYSLPVIDAQVHIPTDWTRIIPHGVYALYEESADAGIVAAYQAAIVQAIHGSPEDVWCAVHILFFQRSEENNQTAPFCICPDLCNGFVELILSMRPALEERLPYGKNGWNMYEDILRLNQNFFDEWGYPLLCS